MTALNTLDAYRLWAPVYSGETAISQLEDEIVAGLTPPLEGMRLLDAGCGNGRRMRSAGAATAVGVDISAEMIEAGASLEYGPVAIVGDIRALPLPDREFDVAWCRLAIGHVPDCAPVYAELARVTVDGGQVIVSDFHPRAHRAGHRRTFRRDEAVHEVEHYVHEVETHLEAASAAGLRAVEIREAEIGPSVRPFYEAADRLALYDEHRGLPVVLALSFRRSA